MLKKTLIAATAASLMAFGATAANASGGGSGGRHHHYRFNNTIWWGLALSTPCHYETQQVRIKVYDRWGYPHFKWVWRDVKVCY